MSKVATGSSNIIKFGPVRRKIPAPKLVLIHSPTEAIENGRNRKKFPSSKDCCVKIAVAINSVHAGSIKPKRVSIRYECNVNERRTLETINNDSLMNGPTYLLGISSITRHPTDKETRLLDLPTHHVCEHHPLNYNNDVNDFEPGHYGFWLRFFGKPCRFHIMITLKLHKHDPRHDDMVVSTIELDIRNIESICAINRTCSMKSPTDKLHDCLLFSEKGYTGIMEKLQNLQEHCLWEKCVSVGDELLSGLKKGKSDVKACILLEQSKAVSCQGRFVAAKLLIKQALEAIPTKSENKDVLIARAYIYLSLCHHYEFSLGNSEECLRIAREKLNDLNPCEDTADLLYNEGRLLLSFLLKIPNFIKGLVNEAKEKLERAISHLQEACNSKQSTTMNKIYNAQLCLAMLLLLADTESDSAVVAEQWVSTMSNNIPLSQETKCRLSFVKALVLKHDCANEAAITNAKQALDLAKHSGLYIEKQWIVKFLKSLKYM